MRVPLLLLSGPRAYPAALGHALAFGMASQAQNVGPGSQVPRQCLKRAGRQTPYPRPSNVPRLRALWPLSDGVWVIFKGSWGVLDYSCPKALGLRQRSAKESLQRAPWSLDRPLYLYKGPFRAHYFRIIKVGSRSDSILLGDTCTDFATPQNSQNSRPSLVPILCWYLRFHPGDQLGALGFLRGFLPKGSKVIYPKLEFRT